jgi:colicin import membrane protein
MGLHIVIGHAASGNSSACFSVYAGRSAAEARAAMSASNAHHFTVYNNAVGVHKHNAHHDPAKPVIPVVVDPAVAELRARVADLEAEKAAAEKAAAEKAAAEKAAAEKAAAEKAAADAELKKKK